MLEEFITFFVILALEKVSQKCQADVGQGVLAGEEIKMPYNYVCHNDVLPTPISADRLEYMLSGYDPVLKKELISGFAGGFKIGFFFKGAL